METGSQFIVPFESLGEWRIKPTTLWIKVWTEFSLLIEEKPLYIHPATSPTPHTQSLWGVYCFQHVCDSSILWFRQQIRFWSITSIPFVLFWSNLHTTWSILQYTCGKKIGAEGSVLLELCPFIILRIRWGQNEIFMWFLFHVKKN